VKQGHAAVDAAIDGARLQINACIDREFQEVGCAVLGGGQAEFKYTCNRSLRQVVPHRASMEREISDIILELADGKPQFVRAYSRLVDGGWCMPDFAFRHEFGFHIRCRNVIGITRLTDPARLGRFVGIASAADSSGS